MKIALCVKNKFCFVDGLLPCPNPEDDPVQHQVWLRNNNIDIFWLLNAMSKDITPTIVAYRFTLKIWSDLKDHFQQNNGARLAQIQRELACLQQGNSTVS